MSKLNRFNKLIKICLVIILASGTFLAGVLYTKVNALKTGGLTSLNDEKSIDKESVLPTNGFELPISWGDLGPKLISAGVIDEEKFVQTVNLNGDEEKILKEGTDKPITINEDNSQFVVDLLWAIGLAQKSNAYIDGPMGREYKKDIANFSSTAGWTLSKSKATDYLGKFELFNLTPEQQKRVEEIAKNIFRPCCGNSTWFPDCNHGMAALAAIEMMVAKNLPDDEIYKNVLKLNSFWFPGTYLTTAQYFADQGTPWNKVDAKTVLGAEFSSAQGAAQVAKKVAPQEGSGKGSGCGA
ncbi:MAG: hypothetical protein US68_C0038G0007 [Candidatus Shapirobacteria bacterium GW2011_GWE1_38_10]|uniref:Uncharacterized protein n=2 Tax=Microgenomates group TaxID=1794810 RepID=A0A0G0L6L4_9BACT|nr:MAG: hypothetical protein US68_C0038G0007 [Candidatus Shapirobacteria bacterium GW2011_GWE1_38_10]OGM87267.1 MAG: hypothetical protein A2594_01200 [Candidatus Woesebacteria bacterium RIFOXYD1_FULL_41_28]